MLTHIIIRKWWDIFFYIFFYFMRHFWGDALYESILLQNCNEMLLFYQNKDALRHNYCKSTNMFVCVNS